MWRWSVKSLLSEPLRLIVSALAVALAFVLVIFFTAVFEGESERMIAYIEETNADVWVMQKGVSNMHMASSMLWDWKVDKIAQVPGVKDVSAILYQNGPVKIQGKDWFSYVIGVAANQRFGGPWDMAQGKAIPGPGEVVIPEVISRLVGVAIGDTVRLLDRPLRIVGLSRDTFSMSSSIVFVAKDDLADLIEGRDQVSYVMVRAEPGVSARVVAQRIEESVDKVNALTRHEFIESDRDLALQMGAEIIRTMTTVGTLLATLIVAFTSYSIVARKKRELAVAKALGFRSVHVYAAVLCQSVMITGLGLVFSAVIAFAVLVWLPAMVPQINLVVRWHQFVPVAIVSLPIAILASLVTARTVVKIDPMIVFQR